MDNANTYDAAIIGGGLAGLALSIQLARKGYAVVLFEKERYPFHKVCGEYISLESWDFLCSLGVDLKALEVPLISKLVVSSVNGRLLEHTLPLGGFGISRYVLDNLLAGMARNAGVTLLEGTKVNDVSFADNNFSIEAGQQTYRAKLVCGTYGKRSNLDIKWQRPFSIAKKNKLNNYIGVKYHVEVDFPADTIALHNFKNGYCGIVRIEGGKYNLCYLTTADNLKNSNNNIRQMEQQVLYKNPHLEKIFTTSRMTDSMPLTISQISFDKKSRVQDHILMIGDAAGMITPLCGNGMSMALHASKIAALYIDEFLANKISRKEMEEKYEREWGLQFAQRLLTGRRIQRLLGHNWLTNLFLLAAKPFPGLINFMIKKTHGTPF